MEAFERNKNGRYDTRNLSPERFTRLFELIHRDRQKQRRSKARQLTPSVMKNKDLDQILKLGKTKEGTFFTKDDLKGFESSRKAVRKVLNNKQQGITYAQLVANSNPIDVKRANNNVQDGSGITNASFVGIKHNVAMIRVSASQRSVDTHHLVQIRFEEWDEAVDNASGNNIAEQQRMVRNMANGRVSVNCDCGRYQYWYRYIATAGNYTLAPPKEFVYPKLKNPRLEGLACKHIIHSLTRMQGAGWQNRLIQSLRKSAAGEHYADDPKETTEYFSDKEIKALNRNRKSKTDVAAARAAWDRYQARQDAFAGKLTKSDQKKVAEARKLLSRARTVSEKEQQRRDRAKQKLASVRAERDAFKQQLSDMLKMQKQMFIDAQVMAGRTPEQARQAYREHINKKAGQ